MSFKSFSVSQDAIDKSAAANSDSPATVKLKADGSADVQTVTRPATGAVAAPAAASTPTKP